MIVPESLRSDSRSVPGIQSYLARVNSNVCGPAMEDKCHDLDLNWRPATGSWPERHGHSRIPVMANRRLLGVLLLAPVAFDAQYIYIYICEPKRIALSCGVS